jgi:hypothetical protein
VTPQQHLGEVVQQGGLVDHRRVVVLPMHGEAEREAGRAFGPAQHRPQAVERVRIVAQQFLDIRLRPEGAEERPDAEHHQRRGHRLYVGGGVARAIGAGMHEQLQGHQRIGADHVGERARVHRVLVQPQHFELCRRVGEHRDRRGAQMPDPAADIVRRADQGEPRRWQLRRRQGISNHGEHPACGTGGIVPPYRPAGAVA